jgi:hypothetical protein
MHSGFIIDDDSDAERTASTNRRRTRHTRHAVLDPPLPPSAPIPDPELPLPPSAPVAMGLSRLEAADSDSAEPDELVERECEWRACEGGAGSGKKY